MSWIKDQALKAKNIQLTAEDQERAAVQKSAGPRTAPGQLMHLQATAAEQRKEIERLKDLLQKTARVQRPVSKMHEVPGRRRKLTPEEYGELKANLAQYPLANPVILTTRPDGEWDIFSGNNRVAIYRELGREEIDSLVIEIEPELAERVAFFSNLLAPSLSDFEKYWNFKRLQEGSDALTRQELAEAVGLSKSHVSRIFAFEGLPEEAIEALAQRPERLGSHAAAKLANAARNGKADEVTAAIRRLVEDEKFTQEQAVRVVTAAPKPRTTGETLLVKAGKTRFCEITARGGVIGVRLKVDSEDANQWAREIQQFIEQKVRERS